MKGKADRDRKLFVSFFFIAFFVITLGLFYLLPGKWRVSFLCLMSCFWCAYLDIRSLFILVAGMLYCYLGGILLEWHRALRKESFVKNQPANSKTDQPLESRKWLLLLLVGFCVLWITVYKLGTYFCTRFCIQVPESILTQLVMPIGFSFYLFQIISYFVDIYRGNAKAERNFWNLALWLSFFPKLVSGPIEREHDFLPQLQNVRKVKFWHTGRLSVSLSYVLYGYFLKIVIADRLMPMVDRIFNNPGGFDSFFLILGAVLYTFQIYCDFAGYSYIAVGLSELFGIHLTMNFKEPYTAQSMTDFWHRWHISLSSWLRDYLYIPLGGNRKGIVRKVMNNMIVFLVCGMWHGAGLNYIAWGLIHGFYTSMEAVKKDRNKKTGKMVPGKKGECVFFLQAAGVYLLAAFAWIFFRAGSASAALRYLSGIIPMHLQFADWNEMFLTVFDKDIEFWLAFLGIMIVSIGDWVSSGKGVRFPELLQQKSSGVRYVFFVVMILILFVFGIYGPGYDTGQFIYMQF